MNKDTLQTQWPQVRAILRQQFSYLTEDDINQINGRYDQLVAKLQQKYGYSREEAEERIRSFNFDRFSSANSRDQMIRDESIQREFVRRDQSSFIPWLLGLGVPLLLLGTYFLSAPTQQVVKSPTVVQEQAVTETQADRFISEGLRSALTSQSLMAPQLQNLQITTSDGVVTLSGTVPSQEIRDYVVATSQSFAGVRQVINHVQIK